MSTEFPSENNRNRSKIKDHSIPEWRSKLTGLTGSLLLFEIITGLALYILPFSELNQFGLILHSIFGIAMLLPIFWYSYNHWKKRYGGNFNHFQLLGYLSVLLLLLSCVSGLVVTWQGISSERLNLVWDMLHLISSLAFSVFVVLHLTTLIFRKVGRLGPDPELVSARRRFYLNIIIGCLLLVLPGLFSLEIYNSPVNSQAFSENYNWRFGKDRPFAPSFSKIDDEMWSQKLQSQVSKLLSKQEAKIFNSKLNKLQAPDVGFFTKIKQSLEGLNISSEDQLNRLFTEASKEIQQQGALTAKSMANSASCGSSNCHNEIYQEWLPSAHRYSSMDDMFQKVQSLMVTETSSEHTRYCAGCHDPISLFSGAKNSNNITLSVEGADEGASCLICHSITKTDVQGNGNYVIKPPERYLFELDEGDIAKNLSDFLIRTYPQKHIASFSRALYKTPEYCAACHKQYLDLEVNTDIGKVQGQNQYDNWKNSRWSKNTLEDSTTCRECHMPLVDSKDPARGDGVDYNRSKQDGKHRSHRTLGTNQYIPALHQLENQKLHTELTEKWMRGEIEIPEIANKWTAGSAVRLDISAKDSTMPGSQVNLKVNLLNNKAGHDFPTGPMDMIQSWVEVKVTDELNNLIYHGGYLDENDSVQGLPIIYRADGFDREGNFIDRHNLWDLVGASYKRTLYPGMNDNVKVDFEVPDSVKQGSTLKVTARLQYRKANPEFLDRVYGKEKKVRSPVTTISEAEFLINVN
jgi:hypothetical protein